MIGTLVEMAFKRALEKGEIDDLPGAGKPIEKNTLTADPFAHIYRESGTMTPVAALQGQINDARKRLATETDADRRRAIQTEISLLETRKSVEMETVKRYS